MALNICCIDFETYYAKDYGLKKLTYEEYIADVRFEVIGVAVQVNDGEPEWFSGNKEDTYNWLNQFDLENNAVLMHNAMFDASILAFHFNIYPKIILDTLCMARALHGAIVGGSLKALAQYYDVGEKGEEVHNFIGYTRSMFTPEELESYANYCKKDAQLTYYIYTRMAPYFNKTELKLIDMTIRMYTEPKFMYDREFLVAHLKEVQQRQQKLLDDLNLTHKDLRSNLIFADLLRAEGVEPPIKISATTGRETYALAKTDEGMKALLEHENVRVQQLAAARLGVKSSLEETRTQRLIDTGDRNYYYLPIGLNYYGARTGRWSACVVADTRLIVYDTQKGVIEKRIVDVLLDDLIWDGEAFVQHEGVVFNGYAEVITWDGITGTEDHVVFTEDGERSLHSAMQTQCRIKVAGAITEDAVDAARKLSSTDKK